MSYACDECEFTCKTENQLKTHTEQKHDGLVYLCQNCNATYKSKAALNVHLDSKHTGLIFKCEKCSKTYSTRNNLSSHVKTVHADKIVCEKCNTKVISKYRTVDLLVDFISFVYLFLKR